MLHVVTQHATLSLLLIEPHSKAFGGGHIVIPPPSITLASFTHSNGLSCWNGEYDLGNLMSYSSEEKKKNDLADVFALFWKYSPVVKCVTTLRCACVNMYPLIWMIGQCCVYLGCYFPNKITAISPYKQQIKDEHWATFICTSPFSQDARRGHSSSPGCYGHVRSPLCPLWDQRQDRDPA